MTFKFLWMTMKTLCDGDDFFYTQCVEGQRRILYLFHCEGPTLAVDRVCLIRMVKFMYLFLQICNVYMLFISLFLHTCLHVVNHDDERDML